MQSLGLRLKQIRKAKGISQIQIAQWLGLEQSTISNYENNIRIPQAGILKELASYLNVTTDYLLGKIGNRPIALKVDFSDTENSETIRKRFFNALLDGREEEALALLLKKHYTLASLIDLYTEVLHPILVTVGEEWQKGRLEISQEHYITSIIERVIALSAINIPPEKPKGKSALFVMPGAEEHILPLKMALEIFKCKGWKTYDLGRSVPVHSLDTFIQRNKVQLIVLSVTIREHINSCEYLIRAIKEFPKAYRPLVMVGGHAIQNDPSVQKILGADFYGNSLRDVEAQIHSIEAQVAHPSA